MYERLRAMADDELGAALVATGAALWVPPVDMAASVVARVSGTPVVDLRRPRTVRRAVLVAVAAVLLLGGAAVAGRLGLPGLRIVFGGSTHAAVQRPLLLGRQTTLDRARKEVSFRILTPNGGGVGPAQVYVGNLTPGGEVSLAYPPSHLYPRSRFTRTGVLVTEFEGRLDEGFLKKIVPGKTKITSTFVKGIPALWFSGGPHELGFVDRNGIPLEPVRASGNALVWAVGGVTIRLECNCGESAAVRLAESIG